MRYIPRRVPRLALSVGPALLLAVAPLPALADVVNVGPTVGPGAPAPTGTHTGSATADSVRILVVYYSRTGNTEEMARAVAAGAESVSGASVRLAALGDVTAADLEKVDGLVVGSPTHWANLATAVKAAIDEWPFMDAVVGGAFATGGTAGGGHEHVITSLLLAMLNHGMVVVGPAFQEGAFRWAATGAAALTGPVSPGINDVERDGARRLGERVARVALRMERR